ncbi:MAG: ABC transporter ATP-binding protein [Lachnospiraceae bacterium]|nr:ABC transporter ATP-binding protein [Lachnospiraceae bacterium]
MAQIFKNIGKYWYFVILIFVLLLAQAYGDLSLPQYTSDIIDTGIQNKGIAHVLPEKLVSEEYEYAILFMTEEEKAAFAESYERSGEIYQRVIKEKKELEELDDKLVLPIVINYQMEAVEADTFKKQLWENGQISDALSAYGVTEEAFYEMSVEDIGTLIRMDIHSYEKDIEDTDGNVAPTEVIDMRSLYRTMADSGIMDRTALDSARAKFTEMSETIGSSTLKSMGIAWAVEREAEAGIDIDQKQKDYLWASCFRMIGMAFLIAVAVILVSYFAAVVGGRVGRDLRETVFSKVLSFSGAEMDRFSTASLITRNTNDIQQVQLVSTLFLRMLLYAPILGIGGVIKVYQTGANMGWVIALAVVVVIGLVGLLMSATHKKFRLMQKQVDAINLVAREMLTGISVIRAFGRETQSEERFDKANRDLTGTQLFVNRVMSFMMPGMMLIMYMINILIMWTAAHRIDDGIMQVGTMTAFLTYAMQIIMSFLMLSMMSIMLPRAGAAAERIHEIVTTESSIQDAEDAGSMGKAEGVVRFEKVHFRYPHAEEDVLNDISFTAEPGKTTAIIGSTGCGKSTLVNLIPRLYDVTGGSITIDGADIRELKLKELRACIGFVPQKAVLFSGTIASNLRFGKREATGEEIAEAVEIAQAAEFIEAKSEKYESPIAEGGSNVSGGQKQRLAIARAIAKDPKIYVFDDSFSALDMKTDAALRKAIKEKSKNSTVIIVAQRISTILHADQILVLDDGKIVGMGTHKELLESCEEYLEIAKSQLSEKEIESTRRDR